jgi:CheY-like chemotaxis protein
MDSGKVVLDVGQCDPDHASIRRVVQDCGYQVTRVHTGDDAKKLLGQGGVALVLVNRILDRDGSDGMALIRELIAIGGAPIMLVSNYPEYQQQAVAMGALPGFGKASLREATTSELLKNALAGS